MRNKIYFVEKNKKRVILFYLKLEEIAFNPPLMSHKENASLDTLPVEVVHKIFGYLDTRTIVRLLRCVCKRLYTIVNTYDRFNFDFNSILKSDFLFICNYIQPKNVISLTLSDDDETPGQIQYFLSLFRVSYFTQLHSLTLIEIDDCYLSIILKDIKTCLLNSLTIHSQRDYSQNNTNSNDFSSVISLLTLRKLDLKLPNFDLSTLLWPVECRIQHLEIDCRTLDQYYNIVRHLPNLKVFVVGQLDEKMNDGTIAKPDDLESFRQLYCLTLKYCNIDMIILELILSVAPSIKHLKLMRSIDLDVFTSNLTRWENFVKSKLLLLNQFEFFLLDNQQFFFVNPPSTPVDTELIITPFRTSFWIETKKWFVICDYIISPRTIILYTPSFFDPQFEYFYQSKQISRSTSLSTMNNTIILDGVRKIRLDLENIMPLATSTEV